ncbi:MAG: glutamyl-tRNA reductase [Solirubrobacteraceae bacterium]|jgi:glutamyl-tRNA reductase|nr:glutamyl-tRNA reductase [Solirubrobacteraceae bacterium]
MAGVEDCPRLQAVPASDATLVVVGVSHRTAPVAFRERLALLGAAADELLAEVTHHPAVTEAVTLATCNRTELYLASDPVEGERVALAALARRAGVTPAVLRRHGYVLRGAEVAGHLFAVASGLESAVVGEGQILGQVRRAHELALECGTAGTLTSRLFTDAVSAGRRVRAQTPIARAGVSVSSVAVEIARDHLGDLASRRVLVVGTGRSGELTAKALADRGVAVVVLANRCERRAEELAARYGVAIPLAELARELEQADVVITATASPHQLITRDDVAAAMAARDGRPLLIVDLALPRDVEPAVGELDGVTLADLDDVQRRSTVNLSARREHAGPAAAIAAAEAERFERWRAGLAAAPTIAALHGRAQDVVEGVLRENAGRWESASIADRRRIEALARAIAQRLLHEPTAQLRRAAQDADEDALRLARGLFALDAPEAEAPVRRAASQ